MDFRFQSGDVCAEHLWSISHLDSIESRGYDIKKSIIQRSLRFIKRLMSFVENGFLTEIIVVRVGDGGCKNTATSKDGILLATGV